MDARDSRLVPGMSAKTAQRLLTALTWGWTIVLPLGILSIIPIDVFIHWSNRAVGAEIAADFAVGGLPLILCIVTITVAASASTRTSRAEVAAGYTTLLDHFDQVDGVDSRTGIVVRPAAPQNLSASTVHAIGSGHELGSIETERTPTVVVAHTAWASIGTLASGVSAIVGIVAVARDPNDVSGWFWLLASVGALGVFIFPLFGYAYAPVGFYLGQLRSAYPSAKVLPGSSRSGDIIGELLASDEPRLPGARDRLSGYIVFEHDRAIFYSRWGTQLVPFLELPRSRVHSGGTGALYNANGLPTSAALFSVTKDDGTSLEVTLGFAPSGIASPMRVAIEIDDDSTWVKRWAQAASTD